jgi:hypothetical protein
LDASGTSTIVDYSRSTGLSLKSPESEIDLFRDDYIETVPKKGFRFVATIRDQWCTETHPMLEHQDEALPTERPDDASQVPAVVTEKFTPDSASHADRTR